jgi:hypothetical protein
MTHKAQNKDISLSFSVGDCIISVDFNHNKAEYGMQVLVAELVKKFTSPFYSTSTFVVVVFMYKSRTPSRVSSQFGLHDGSEVCSPRAAFDPR